MPLSLFFKSIIGLIITSVMLSVNVLCAVDPHYVHHDCTRKDNLYASGSIFEDNLNTTLLNVLPVNASLTGYSRHTTGNASNQVYAVSYCRGDVTGQYCRDCVEDAGRTVLQRCEHLKEGIIWYEECTLHYSNRSTIFSTEEVTPSHLHHNFSSILKSLDQEKNTFEKLMNGLIGHAAKEDEQGKIRGYATGETPLLSSLPQSLILRAEVQCRPESASSPCEICLRSALKQMNRWSTPMVFLPNCNLRFDLFPSQITAPPTSSGGGGSLPRRVLVPVVVTVAMVSIVILSSIVCLIIRYRRKQQQQGDRDTHLAESVQPNNMVGDQRGHRPDEESGGVSLGNNPLQNAEQRDLFPEPSAPPLPADTKFVSFYLVSGHRHQLEDQLRENHARFWILLNNSSMPQQWRWFCTKVMHNDLPRGRSLGSSRRKTVCAFCWEDETSTHLLRDCFLARRMWRSTRLGLIIKDNVGLHISTWFRAIFIYLHSIKDDSNSWTELVATMWAIWLHRNNVVLRGATADPMEIMNIVAMEKSRWTSRRNNNSSNNNNNVCYYCQTDVWYWGDHIITLILITNGDSKTKGENNWLVMKGDTIIAQERRRLAAKSKVQAEKYAMSHGLKECIRFRRPYKWQLHIWTDSSQVANAFCNPFSIARDSNSIYLFF